MFAIGDKVTLKSYPPDWVFEVIATYPLAVSAVGLPAYGYGYDVRYTSGATQMTVAVHESEMFPWNPPNSISAANFNNTTSEIDFDIFDDELTQPICIVHKEGSTPVSLSEKAGEVWVICKNCGIAMRPATEKPTPVWKIPSNWPKP